MKRLFLIDGSALAYRSHFAFAAKPLINKHGLVTSAVFGFATALIRILDQEKPDYFAVVIDHSDKTFRHEEYSDYKATRQKMPEDLRAQLPYIKNVVEAMRIPFISIPGFEADDVIGTLAQSASQKKIDTYMVTGDKDFLQLLSPNIFIYSQKLGGEVEILNEAASEKKWGVPVNRVTDMLALMGDSSDNIPGVPGIGEKTATKLIQEYGSLESIYEKIANVMPEKVRQKLMDHKDQAFLCKRLVTICTDVKVPIAVEELVAAKPDNQKLTALYRELEFQSLLKKLDDTLEIKTSKPTNYILVRTMVDLDELIEKLKSQPFSFDTETVGIHPMGASMVGAMFSFKRDHAFFVNFAQSEFSKAEFIEKIRSVMEDASIPKGGQDVKFDRHVFLNEGIRVQGIQYDTMIESYLIDPNTHQHGLDSLALKHLNLKKISYTELSSKGKLASDQIDIAKLTHYACEHADSCFQLHDIFLKLLNEQNLTEIYKKVEIPLIEVLGDMERNGFSIDTELLSDLSKHLDERIADLESKIKKIAGEDFNVKSPKQLGPILFEKLKIQSTGGSRKVKKTKTGYSTDQETLEKFSDHEIIPFILEYRNVTKLKSTYVDTLPLLVHPKTKRIHSTFNQTVAATGRLSSSDPNLQNIPIRAELGREIRKAFVASSPDNVILSADYSQIELRFLAHFTKDPTLIKTFGQNEDIHTITAALIFHKPFHEVTPELRSRAKTINFGIIYGMGPQRLAREIQISVADAKQFIDAYFQTYSDVKNYFNQQVEFAKTHGYVETILGRRRPVPDINSKNSMLQSFAERVACNTPLQGSSADLIKVAMISIHKELREKDYQTKMLLQVHDELVFEVPLHELSKASAMIKSHMENAIPLDVPLVVDISSGKNWNES